MINPNEDVGYQKNTIPRLSGPAWVTRFYRSSKMEGLEARLCDSLIDVLSRNPPLAQYEEGEVWEIIEALKTSKFTTFLRHITTTPDIKCEYCSSLRDEYIFEIRADNERLGIKGVPRGCETTRGYGPRGVYCPKCNYIEIMAWGVGC